MTAIPDAALFTIASADPRHAAALLLPPELARRIAWAPEAFVDRVTGWGR